MLESGMLGLNGNRRRVLHGHGVICSLKDRVRSLSWISGTTADSPVVHNPCDGRGGDI